ncbi:MAG: hypothetical protein J1E63_02115 [Muribaculaceae bacterium]|nr:hypothetical protein [Muribaculaceae bacterium]
MIHKFSILVALAAILLPIKAKADTLLDFYMGDGNALELFSADGNKASLPMSSNGLTVDVVNGITGQITLKGFYQGNFDVDFHFDIVTGFYIQPGTFPARDTKPDGTPADYAGKQLVVTRALKAESSLGCVYFAVPDTLKAIVDLAPGILHKTSHTANALGGYDFTMGLGQSITGDQLAAVMNYIGQNSTLGSLLEKLGDKVTIYTGAVTLAITDPATGRSSKELNVDTYTLSTYVSNAIVTERYNGADRSYPARVTTTSTSNGNIAVDLYNLGNNGFALAKTKNDDGNAAININPLTLTINPGDEKFAFDIAQPWAVNLSAFTSLVDRGGNLIGQGTLCAAKKGLFGQYTADTSLPIGGSIETLESNLTHGGKNSWTDVTGGDFTRAISTTMRLNFTTPYLCHYTLSNSSVAENTVIELQHNQYLTPDVAIVDSTCTATIADGNIYLTLDLRAAAVGADYIDGYQIGVRHYNELLDIIPSTYFHDELGLKEATLLDESHVAPAALAVTTESGTTSRLNFIVPVDQLVNHNSKIPFIGQKEIAAGQKLQLFVKTAYADGSTPSFHSLQLVDINDRTSTGIEAVTPDATPAVYYNLNGIIVDPATAAPGVYIRRQGATATKITL